MKRIIAILLMTSLLTVTCFAENTDNEIDTDTVMTEFDEMLQSDSRLTENIEIINSNEETEINYTETEISLDANFSEDSVLLTLTKEESVLNKTYSPSDFPEIDIEEISVLIPYREDWDNKVSLCITLANSTKKKVIEAIAMLYQDSRVRSASPNYIYTIEDSDDTEVVVEESEAAINGTNSIYTEEDKTIEARADKNTYACCARQYIDPSKNTTVKVGIVDDGIFNTQNVSSKVVQYVDFTLDADTADADGYTNPAGWHGTQVANVIARDQIFDMESYHSCGNNVCYGTCPNIQLYSLKTRYKLNNKKESRLEYYANAIYYAMDNDIDILNVSNIFMCEEDIPQYAVDLINEYDGLIICTGNNTGQNLDTLQRQKPWYPFDCDRDRIIVVGNCEFNSDGTVVKHEKSDYGKTRVDVFAPGHTFNLDEEDDDQYDLITGTSFAAPRVAGAAAILKTINPNITAEEMKYYILAGVDQYSDLSQYCVTGGSINIYKSAKLLIADLAYENKTIFSGHFDTSDPSYSTSYNLQIAAYCQVDDIQTKCYVWTYDSYENSFEGPKHILTNNSFALEYAPYGAYNMHRSVAGDFDGDGLDEICTLYDYQNYIFIQGRDYSVHPTNHLIGADVHNFTGRVVALDYDNDGKDEIAALYEETSAWGHTKLYVWDFSGTKTGMSVTQRIVYDSGAGNYQATYATHRVASGDFDGDGYEEMGVVYYYPQTGKYSLHKFDISNSGATYTSLIFQQNNIDATKVTGRVVGCNYNGGSTDEILCLYDNNAQINNSLKIQGFYLENTNNSWNATFTYTNEHFDANNVTHLLVSGYFTNDGYEDSAVFFHLVDQNLSDNILDDKTRILICPNAYSCYNLIWDPKL